MYLKNKGDNKMDEDDSDIFYTFNEIKLLTLKSVDFVKRYHKNIRGDKLIWLSEI